VTPIMSAMTFKWEVGFMRGSLGIGGLR